jgi:pyruvate dehydrogenase (quinone)
VKIIVFSNSALAFVELEMMAAGILGQGTELVNPDFVAVARSAGMFGVRVEDPADLKKAVTEAFQHDGPALVDAVVNRTALSMPPTIKLDQAVGFNLWALKAVLSGRGDELIDLAVHSLIRWTADLRDGALARRRLRPVRRIRQFDRDGCRTAGFSRLAENP